MSRVVNRKYSQVRAGLLKKGTNLRRWACENGFPVTTVYGAAKGERGGIKAIKIQTQLEEFLNG